MHSLLDKIEGILVKTFLILAVSVLVFQFLIKYPSWSNLLVLLNRLEGAVYDFPGL